MIPKSFIDDLVARSNIVEIVGRHVELKKGGASFKGLCPFHSEKKASFTVTPSRNTYHCFGCGAHGDALKFLTEYLGLQFVEAVKELAQIVGVTVPDDGPTDRRGGRAETPQPKSTAAPVRQVLQQAEGQYAKALRSSQPAIDFLKSHGVVGKTAARYRLGFAGESERGLASVFPNYGDQGLVDAGLVVVEGDGRRDRFVNQVMFPVKNVHGADIGFVGTHIAKEKAGVGPVMVETALFQPARELYGVFEARDSIRTSGYAVVVEGGCMEVMLVAQCGVTNVIGPVRGRMTPDQLTAVCRLTKRVMFLKSAAGQEDLEALTSKLPPGVEIKVATIPGGAGPSAHIAACGAQALRDCMGTARALRATAAQAAA